MQKGGVIMDVVNAEQARIAEEAGAVAVMALEAVPADIRKDDPERLAEIASNIGKSMKGDANVDLPDEEKMQGRGV